MQNSFFHRFAILLGASLCLSPAVYSQESVSVIDSLRVPASPAFKIIGTEPTAVERPTDLKALAVDLSTLATGDKTSQFALEFGLSKLFSSGKKGLFDYYYPSVGSTIVDNLSISFASASIPADMFVDSSLHASTAWSFGFRTHILGGGYAMDKATFKQAIRNRISLTDNVDRFLKYVLLDIVADSGTRAQLQSQIAAGGFTTGPTSTLLFENAFAKVMLTTPTLLTQVDMQDIALIKTATSHYFFTFVRNNSQALTSLAPPGIPVFLVTYNDWSTANILNSPAAVYSAQQLAKMLAQKSGHFLELAAAGAGVGRDNKVDQFSLKRLGAWLSYSYRPSSTEDWEGAAMLRMISNQVDSANKIASYDLGCRASSPRLWSAAVSFEAIVRLSPESKPDYRVAVIGEYPLTESFYLTATFGRGFDLPTSTSGNLLSILGVKFGLGSPKLVLTDADLK
jgi:hypothetical protein